MGLYKKMFDVMQESNGLVKDMNVAGQYQAVSEKVMLNEIKPLLKKHGLIIFPVKTEITEQSKGNKSITQVNVSYKIVDVETGENEILSGVGNGADTQDKGAGKAFTYAYKAMLSKTFMLFSGEDTDNDHSDSITKNNLIETIKELSVQKGVTVKKIEEGMKNDLIKMSIEDLNKVVKTLKAKPDVE